MKERDLKPCPFCGNDKPKLMHNWGDAVIYCSQCDSSSGCYDTEEEAIEAWNRRKVSARND